VFLRVKCVSSCDLFHVVLFTLFCRIPSRMKSGCVSFLHISVSVLYYFSYHDSVPLNGISKTVVTVWQLQTILPYSIVFGFRLGHLCSKELILNLGEYMNIFNCNTFKIESRLPEWYAIQYKQNV